jgi:2-polyprenyl-6-hydroxyphenyl methylase/3-demethylubiquinone-9 3-methyltransferase
MKNTTDNVSQEEINKFNQFAQDWWDPHGSMRPLHILNPLRCDYVNQRAPLAGKAVLDVGCGAGLLSEAMAQLGAGVSAIDMSEEALKVATAHAQSQQLSIDYQQTPVEKLAEQQPESFDIVTCMEMLEHVPDPSSIIKACAKLTKPGGYLFFSTINRTLQSYAKAIVGAEYVLRLLPRGTHEYAKFIRPSELDQWARDAGLICKALNGVDYNPFSETCQLTDSVAVNYLCCYAKPTL